MWQNCREKRSPNEESEPMPTQFPANRAELLEHPKLAVNLLEILRALPHLPSPQRISLTFGREDLVSATVSLLP